MPIPVKGKVNKTWCNCYLVYVCEATSGLNIEFLFNMSMPFKRNSFFFYISFLSVRAEP